MTAEHYEHHQFPCTSKLSHSIKEILKDAITILKNETNNHRVMQIDLDLLAKDDEQLEDVYHIIEIELCKKKETIPWEQVKQLHDEGKL